MKGHNHDSLEPSFPWLGQPEITPDFFIGEVFQPFVLLHWMKFYGITPQDRQDLFVYHPFPHALLSLVSPEKLLSALNHTVRVINKDIEQPYTDPWGTPYVPDLHLDIEPLTTALCIWPIQIIPYASNSLSAEHLSQWFSDKHVVWDCVKGLAEVKTDGISFVFFSLSINTATPLQETTSLVRHNLPFFEGYHVGCFESPPMSAISLDISSGKIFIQILSIREESVTGW